MTPTQAVTLMKIGTKPTTTHQTSLTIIRRAARYFCEIADAIHDERRMMRRGAAVLRRFEPFTKQQADALEQQAKDYGADTLATIRNVLLDLGQSLLHDGDGYLAALGFDGVCDVLNANTVEREQARLEGVDDLSDLIFVRNLEDSASHRGEDFKRGPLFEACLEAMGHFIRTAPKGTLPDPFAPGEVFGPKRSPKLQLV
ncbi:hypothetical protein [Azotobacter salinestris]|uniref:hypothetical protein n=1 Tax=Azotobacter salinestris TaxID=69964 RepID=UPI0032DED0B4